MSLPSTQIIPVGNFNAVDAPSYDLLVHCMRCGLCLPTCPTYSLYQEEKASPRGRLSLMRAVSEGRLEVTDGFADAMTLCLGCLACQTACPAGVPFGHLFEGARKQAEDHQRQKRSPLIETARKWIVEMLLYSPHGLEPLMPLMRLYQRMGLPRLNIARLLPGPFGGWERMLPWLQARSAHQALGERVPAVPPLRGRVGLLTGCLENTLLAGMCTATAKILSYNGFELIIPKNQVCCGALPAHLGDLDLARQQARQNIDAFSAAGVETVISDAAGCSAQLKEYGYLLSNDPLYRERAKRFAANSRDATEFLAEHFPLREGMQPLNLRVAYDDPCHLIHAQGIYIQPRELLRSIPSLELVDLPESSWCCGSAGTYNLTHTAEASALLKRKMDHLRNLNVDVLATANTGCYIQLAAGVREHNVNVKITHIVELIAQAYGLQG